MVVVAILYWATARIGQLLAIAPGNVTPVWIPSGIILAAVLIRGHHVWPGIFAGAFIGNVWAYFDASSWRMILASVFCGTANGLGDALGAVVAATLIRRATRSGNIFGRAVDMVWFIVYGAVLGPLLSALFGVTALAAAGFLPWERHPATLLTWWTGDGVGVLILTPLILAWAVGGRYRGCFLESCSFIVVWLVISAWSLRLFPFSGVPHFFLIAAMPLLLWAVFRVDRRITFSAIFVVAFMAILASSQGLGLFRAASLNEIIIDLQLFLAAITMPIFVLGGVVTERERAQEELREHRNHLEELVRERTAALQEEIIARRDTENELKRSLKEKEVLLQELYHRVKNNLQVVSSLLRLQSRKVGEPEAVKALRESHDRIRSMALIHEKLCRSQDLARIGFHEYVHGLAEALLHANADVRDRITVKLSGDDLEMDIAAATPCGLMLNELLTNALTHAFPDGRRGEVEISLRQLIHEEVELVVRDNGVGFSEEVSFRETESLGLHLVIALAEDQLGGDVELDRSAGTEFRIRFPNTGGIGSPRLHAPRLEGGPA